MVDLAFAIPAFLQLPPDEQSRRLPGLMQRLHQEMTSNILAALARADSSRLAEAVNTACTVPWKPKNSALRNPRWTTDTYTAVHLDPRGDIVAAILPAARNSRIDAQAKAAVLAAVLALYACKRTSLWTDTQQPIAAAAQATRIDSRYLYLGGAAMRDRAAVGLSGLQADPAFLGRVRPDQAAGRMLQVLAQISLYALTHFHRPESWPEPDWLTSQR